MRSPLVTSRKFLFEAALDAGIREIVREADGLFKLITMIKHIDRHKNEATFIGLTAALWRCAQGHKNVVELTKFKTVQMLRPFLRETHDDILTNVVGALSELVELEENRTILRLSGDIPLLINFLNFHHEPLLINVAIALGRCALDPDCLHIIQGGDGIRLIWSLLKHKNPTLQAKAGWALWSCLKFATDVGEEVRSLPGAISLAMKLLTSENLEVVSAGCATIAEIAHDAQNLEILSNYGLVPTLVKMLDATDESVRENLAHAIASSCSSCKNRTEFGRLRAIVPLIKFLSETNKISVKMQVTKALYQLSKNPFNCIAMHEGGLVPRLLRVVTTCGDDEQVQNFVAGCLNNIRETALKAETYHLAQKVKDSDSESTGSVDTCR